MRVVSFVRGVVCLGKSVDTRRARAAGASVDVDAEKEGKVLGMLFMFWDSRERGESRRRRGRVELMETPCCAVRLEERTKLVDGPDVGVLKDDAAKLLAGVKLSSWLVSRSRGLGLFASWGV
jgi:hypothetical protein